VLTIVNDLEIKCVKLARRRKKLISNGNKCKIYTLVGRWGYEPATKPVDFCLQDKCFT
jgi:hypothetical protein